MELIEPTKILFYLCFIKFYERTRETEELT